ncbi:MAG: collagen-like protein [Oscillospiraceae bacterium]|jgi:hypothetical protein|nr:collagen-like protein [Oscillospiraceae bacterium]
MTVSNTQGQFDPYAVGFAEPTYCCKYFRGVTGAQGATGATGARGETGPQGEQGPQGPAGTPASVEILRTITGKPGSNAAVLNAGNDTNAELTFVIPAGAAGVRGATGPQGLPGIPGARGATGIGAAQVFGGLYNVSADSFKISADEIVTIKFSDVLPNFGILYDERHSIVTKENGVYEIHFTLRAEGRANGALHVGIANDGMLIPCTDIVKQVNCGDHFELHGKAFAEIGGGAHLHMILFTNQNVELSLHAGVNIMLTAKKIANRSLDARRD